MKLIPAFGPTMLAAAALVAVPDILNAHFKLLEPASWIVESERGDPQKAAPCGADPTAEMSGVVARGTAARPTDL